MGVESSLRVGFLDPTSQNPLEIPIGTHKRSYAFNQNGRLITDAHYSSDLNEKFSKSQFNHYILEIGDIIGV